MSVNEQDEHFTGLWSTLRDDEAYPGLAAYVEAKMSNLQSSLSDFRDSVHDCLSSEERERFAAIIATPCHPPPGCGG
jgi:hypothetical protein